MCADAPKLRMRPNSLDVEDMVLKRILLQQATIELLLAGLPGLFERMNQVCADWGLLAPDAGLWAWLVPPSTQGALSSLLLDLFAFDLTAHTAELELCVNPKDQGPGGATAAHFYTCTLEISTKCREEVFERMHMRHLNVANLVQLRRVVPRAQGLPGVWCFVQHHGYCIRGTLAKRLLDNSMGMLHLLRALLN